MMGSVKVSSAVDAFVTYKVCKAAKNVSTCLALVDNIAFVAKDISDL